MSATNVNEIGPSTNDGITRYTLSIIRFIYSKNYAQFSMDRPNFGTYLRLWNNKNEIIYLKYALFNMHSTPAVSQLTVYYQTDKTSKNKKPQKNRKIAKHPDKRSASPRRQFTTIQKQCARPSVRATKFATFTPLCRSAVSR